MKFKQKPRITKLELTVKEENAKSTSSGGTIEFGKNFDDSEKGTIKVVLKEIIKFTHFDLLLEIKSVFNIEPPLDHKIEEDNKLQTQLMNRILPYTSEIVAYLTNKIGGAPLILPPYLPEEAPKKEDKK